MLFCPGCGLDRRQLAPVVPCPRCGMSLVPAEANVRPATASEAADIIPDDETPARPRSPRRLGLVIGALILLVASVATLLVVALGGADTPARPAAQAAGAAAAAVAPAEPPAAPPPPPMPKWLAIRVERVQVNADGREWDGAVPESSLKQMCGDISKLVGVVRPGLGAAGRLGCALLGGQKQRQTDPRDPDLQILLDAAGVSYQSYIATDQRAHLFGYPFVVPGGVVPAEGIVVSLVDADTDAPRGQEIGSVRIGRDELIAAATAGGVLTRSAGSLGLIEIAVRAHDGGLEKAELALPAREGGTEVRGIAVNAGDVVRIEATGTWQIGSWNDAWLGPDGYTDGRLKDSNLSLFGKDHHGAVVAVVGQQGSAALLQPRPCVRVVSPFSGVIWVGLNDRSPGDNNGEVRLRVFTRAPKESEWRTPGALLGCPP